MSREFLVFRESDRLVVTTPFGIDELGFVKRERVDGRVAWAAFAYQYRSPYLPLGTFSSLREAAERVWWELVAQYREEV